MTPNEIYDFIDRQIHGFANQWVGSIPFPVLNETSMGNEEPFFQRGQHILILQIA